MGDISPREFLDKQRSPSNKELLLRGRADRLVADLFDSRSALDRLASAPVSALDT